MTNTLTRPLVSVLMPAYNHAPYVRAAVESVLGQAYDNLELIAIDDASSDATWQILQSFADARMRISRHDTNQGAHATLNEALALAKGEFIAIINSDDVFHPDRLAACIKELELTGADLVGTDIVLLDDDGMRVTDHWWITDFECLKRVWMETRDWVATLLEGNTFMTTSNFCFRQSWLEAVGDFHDFRYVLDYEWLLRGLVKGRTLAWLDMPLLNYRLHARNTISERPLAANLECASMLRQVFPTLLGTSLLEKTRLDHLASQWERIERYIGEIGAALRHEALVAREDELFQLIRDRDQWVAERDGWISERDTRISELEARMAERDQWIAERDGWISERDAQIADRDGWISERDAQIADRDGWISERDAHIAACETALKVSREKRAAIEGSLSFRLGHALVAPARWLRDLFASK
jgi:glycosyltransferase involved in cell wall biosynthesis